MADTDLASKVLRLTSENLDLRKRLEAKTESWRELGLQLRHTMILCDSLRLRMKMQETENNKHLGGYKSLLGKLKARYELMKEAERKYRESLGNPEKGGREGDIDKHSGTKYSGYIDVDIHYNFILFHFVQTS